MVDAVGDVMVKTFAKNRTGTKSKGQQTGERYWCPHAMER
jgi:hypothetical protein